ncbi:MAG: polyphosphate kinase 2 family protein [Pseudomonadota bacterium]
MFKAISHPYLVADDGRFRLKKADTDPGKNAPSEEECERRLAQCVAEIAELQQVLYAHDRYALLLIFQALDAAGKDGTIRAVLSGVNPAGCHVTSFKSPSAEELDHDFLWRTVRHLPERGRIGVFNRSYYEEVLVVRVHPEFLDAQRLPNGVGGKNFWQGRYESIREHEQHLARNGTVIVKFFLNVSRDEQRRRFLSRLEEPEKHWKFSEKDVAERAYWDEYQQAFEEALNETSRPWAPWYAIPADNKDYMRMTVAEIVRDTLRSLDLKYPQPDAEALARFKKMHAALEDGDDR